MELHAVINDHCFSTPYILAKVHIFGLSCDSNFFLLCVKQIESSFFIF